MSWIAASIRADAVRRLVALNTAAGISVEACRASLVPESLLPFVGVYTDLQQNTLQSAAGTEPRFDTKLHLIVEPRVAASPAAACEALLDQIVGQILDGLLCDSTWLQNQGIDRCGSVAVTTQVTNAGSAFTGMGRIVFVLEYTERYTPKLVNPFAGVDLIEIVGRQQIGATITIQAEI